MPAHMYFLSLSHTHTHTRAHTHIHTHTHRTIEGVFQGPVSQIIPHRLVSYSQI